MAITAHWFTLALQKAANNTLWTTATGWNGDAIKVALCTGTAPVLGGNGDTFAFWSAISANEVGSGGGYTTGGSTVTGKSVGAVVATRQIPLLGANSVWSSASFSCTYAVVYNSQPGTNATDPVLGWVDFGGTETVASGTFTIQWDATNGILALSAS